VTGEPSEKPHVQRALEAFIHIGLLVVLAAACLLIMYPFLPLIAWGIIIAIAGYPAYCKLQAIVGGRGRLAAVLFTLILLAVLMLPVALLTGTVVEGAHSLAAHLKEGTLTIPPPPAGMQTWPLIGVPLENAWSMASSNLTGLLKNFAPQIKEAVSGMLSASAGVGLAVLQFVLSILVAGGLLANAHSGAEATRALSQRLLGDKGPEFEQLVGSTIRSVTTGILGVALIQSALAALGFVVVGLAGAGLWAILFLFAAVLQVGVVVLIPAAIYVFTIASTTKATIFLIWCIIVGLMDNVLKPVLLGRGVAVPIAVVFLGAIGGFLAVGIIGLFVGAIVLSVGYKLFIAWLEGPTAATG
jgi:predicted PurR-regulated permease PerM